MTPYHIIINNVHNFCTFNFWTSHAVRKYFNNENFPIYGSSVWEVERGWG